MSKENESSPNSGSLIHGFRYDIFLSYARLDSKEVSIFENGEAERTSFIAYLAFSLEERLSKELRKKGIYHDPRIFYDARELESGDLEHEIKEAVGSSVLLVPFISENYKKSGWCQTEKEIFLQRRMDNIEDKKNIFPVTISGPVEAAILKSLNFDDLIQKYDAWTGNGENIRSLFHGVDRDMQEYCTAFLDSLSAGIAKRLSYLADLPSSVQNKNRRKDDKSDKIVVYLAETTDDLVEERKEVENLLATNGCIVRPRPLPLNTTFQDWLSSLGPAMEECQISVQLFGKKPGRTFPMSGLEFGLPYFQYWYWRNYCQLDAHEDRSKRPLLAWQSSACSADRPISPEHQGLSQEHGVCIGSFVDFKKKISSKIKSLRSSPPPTQSVVNIVADDVDLEFTTALKRGLINVGWNVRSHSFGTGKKTHDIEKLRLEALRECDSLIILAVKASPAFAVSHHNKMLNHFNKRIIDDRCRKYQRYVFLTCCCGGEAFVDWHEHGSDHFVVNFRPHFCSASCDVSSRDSVIEDIVAQFKQDLL